MTPAAIRELADRLAALSQPGESHTIVAVDIGRIAFADADALQRELQDRRREDPDAVGNLALWLEHDPVFTITRRAKREHVRWDATTRAAHGVTLADVDRGGDVTCHAPGQIVGYPLLDLRPFGLGSSAYVHALETAVIGALHALGVTGARREPGMPGAWVSHPVYDRTAKISAIGVRVSRGLTRHGLSLNHHPDLALFDGIVPCGLQLPVTSFADLPGVDLPTRDQVLDALDTALAAALTATVERCTWPRD